MAVLEIQANGDTAVSKEAIVNAGQSLEDPHMRVSVQNTSRPKQTPVQPRKTWRLKHTTQLTLAHTHTSINWLIVVALHSCNGLDWFCCLLPAGVHTVLFASRSQAPSHGSRPSVPPSLVRGPLPQTARRPLPHQ